MDVSQLTPRRPYLLRAFYEWLLDNQLTPHLVVDVTLPGVLVPMEYARDGQIVLNIAPRAVGNLELANDEVRFNARFGGVPRNVSVPLAAVLAIYARENGAGTMFEPEATYDEDVSSLNDDDVVSESENETVMSVIDGDKPDNHDDDPDDTPPPRTTTRLPSILTNGSCAVSPKPMICLVLAIRNGSASYTPLASSFSSPPRIDW